VSDRLIVVRGGLAHRLNLAVLGLFIFGPYAAVVAVIWLMWNRWFSWIDVILLVGTYIPIAAGVTVGLHRYFTHRSFETNRVVRIILGILALLALEGKITQWVANHLWHHSHADTEEDLHSPLDGLWHAHTGWIFGAKTANPEAFGITRALLRDPDIQVLDRLYPLFALISVLGVGPIGYAFGGWQGAASAVLLGGVTRFFLVHHFTWSINSLCHMVGEQPYRGNDSSTNLWILAWPTLGESFHRTHHAFPWSALQGSAWWNDASYAIIKVLERLRLAWNIRVPTPEQYAAKRVLAPVVVREE
jgi:stearoyl-CoA desaturase (Delta-9 desaturase)